MYELFQLQDLRNFSRATSNNSSLSEDEKRVQQLLFDGEKRFFVDDLDVLPDIEITLNKFKYAMIETIISFCAGLFSLFVVIYL